MNVSHKRVGSLVGKGRLLRLSLFLLIIAFTISCSQEQSRSIRLPSQKPTAESSPVGFGDLYAVIVGVSAYRNPKIPKLRFSDKDARDFADFLKSQKGLFRDAHINLLVNEHATQTEVKKQLFYELKRAGKDDTVVLFLAGHGADDPNMPGEFFFLTYDADPDYLEATAVNMGRSWFMQRIDSKRVLVIADTCHAGGFSTAGARSSESALKKLMNQFQESEGRVFLTSSRPDEISREEASLGNGVFTYHLLEGLKGKASRSNGGVVTLQDAYEYVYEKTKNATKGMQHPQMEGKIVGKFPVALARLEPSPVPAPQPSSQTGTIQSAPSELYRLRTQAERGDASAQFELGVKYEYGFGVSKDKAESMKWYSKASEQGNGDAKGAIARLSPTGTPTSASTLPPGPSEPVPSAAAVNQTPTSPRPEPAYEMEPFPGFWNQLQQMTDERFGFHNLPNKLLKICSDTRSFEAIRRSAERGHALGLFHLGLLHANQEGLPNGHAGAAKWYRKAAEQGMPQAHYLLGNMSDYGWGVPKDRSEAGRWYRNARELYQKAANQGNPVAQRLLAYMYNWGQGGVSDPAEALKLFRKAAEQGDAPAQNYLGEKYLHGHGVPTDYQEAVKWFRKAAVQGHEHAQHSLGQCYEQGAGVPTDYAEAATWHRKAADQDFRLAQHDLGVLYRDGKGVSKNYSEAVEWFRKAAEQGWSYAQMDLGEMYQYGRGVPKDRGEAMKWYRKAAEQDNREAAEKLEKLGAATARRKHLPVED